MGRAAMRRALVLCLFAGLGLAATGAAPGAPAGRWQDLNVPGSQVAVGSGGQLWVLTDDGLLYWDGRQFSGPKLSETKWKPRRESSWLLGSPGTGAYALVPDGDENHGSVYRLADGEVRLVSDFYFESISEAPCFYISRDGVFINWGQRFIATRREGQEWQRIEVKPLSRPIVAESAHHVLLAEGDQLYIIDAQGAVAELAAPELSLGMTGHAVTLAAAPRPDGMVLVTSTVGMPRATFLLDMEERQLRPWQDPRTTGHLVRVHMTGAGGSDNVFEMPDLAIPPPPDPLPFLTPDGSTRFIDMPESDLWPDRVTPPRWGTRIRLAASDGTLWNAPGGGVVTRLKDGKQTVYDWHDGLLTGQVRCVLEGAGGQVFACSWGSVCVFFPGEEPLPAPAWHALWEEHRLVVTTRATQDSMGRLWMRLATRPTEMAVWNGKDWGHVAVDGDTYGIEPLLADDRGHLLVLARGGHERTYCDASLDGVKTYDDVHKMLLASVADGARRFTPAYRSPGCYVLEDGHIWYGHDYYDGKEWHQGSSSSADVFLESARYGVLFGDKFRHSYSYYERGQFTEWQLSKAVPTLWLVGPLGWQPYEGELLRRHPGSYLPVQRMPDGTQWLLPETPASDEPVPAEALGDEVPGYAEAATAGMPPVCLLEQSGRSSWVVHGRAFPADYTGTPLQGDPGSIEQVFVDPAGDMWFIYSCSNGPSTSAFVKHMKDFRIAAGPAPEQAGSKLPLDVRLEQPGLEAGKGRVFWRLNDGPWQGGVPPGKVVIPFADSGNYRIELIGVDPQGGVTPQPVRLAVQAAVADDSGQVAKEQGTASD